jgi:glycosyltransferase involved in cell wall biosynthesis
MSSTSEGFYGRHDTVRSLVLMHVPANSGYAIAPLERLFHSLLLELGCSDPHSVHFAYAPSGAAHPESLPAGTPVIEFDRLDRSKENLARLQEYVRTNGIDFVLIFDGQPTGPLYGALRRAGVKRIVAYWGAEISSFNSGFRLLLKRLQVLASRSKVDGLVFESHAMAKRASHGRGVPLYMLDVVPLGIDVSKYTPGPSFYPHETLDIPRDRKIVVYAGHMEERKGVRVIIEAAIELLRFRERKDVHFLLLGDKEGESTRFMNMYDGLGISEFITFGGYRKDLPAIFPGCYIGVIASTGWDSFPRTSLEFAACGLPLVVSDLGGLPECIEENVTGVMIPPGDASALADRIESFLDNPRVAQSMGMASRKRCESEFSLEIQADRLRRVLHLRMFPRSE